MPEAPPAGHCHLQKHLKPMADDGGHANGSDLQGWLEQAKWLKPIRRFRFAEKFLKKNPKKPQCSS